MNSAVAPLWVTMAVGGVVFFGRGFHWLGYDQVRTCYLGVARVHAALTAEHPGNRRTNMFWLCE